MELGNSLERRLTLRQLRIFKTVVDQRNFTRAAEQLSLTQPANVTPIRVNTGPFGETIGNEYRPQKQASQS